MTYQRPAYEEVTLAHGGSTVTLRPSLRAAATLVGSYGFPGLFHAVEEFNLKIISEIILAGAVSRQDAAAFLGFHTEKPLLPLFYSFRLPLIEFISLLQPAPDPKAKAASQKSKPIAWPDLYRDLFETATGWLGWTPEAAWSATPTEIVQAFSGHLAKLKTLHGSGEQEVEPHDPRVEISDSEVADGLARLKTNAKRGRQ